MESGCPKCRMLEDALLQKCDEVRLLEADFKEFREVSKELETELHADLQRMEVRDKALQLEANQLAAETALLQGRLQRLTTQGVTRGLELELALQSHQQEQTDWADTRRALEQTVDDLQRKEREMKALNEAVTDELAKEKEATLYAQCALEASRAQLQAEQATSQHLRQQLQDLTAGPLEPKGSVDGLTPTISTDWACSEARPKQPYLDLEAYRRMAVEEVQSCAEAAGETIPLVQAMLQRAELMEARLVSLYTDSGVLLPLPAQAH